MDQLPNSSREFENRLTLNYHKKNYNSNSKDENLETINIINNENDKTVSNIKYQDFMTLSKFDENNKNDIKNFFEIEDEVQDTFTNMMNKVDYNFMVKNEVFTFQCKNCRVAVANDSKFSFLYKF